MKLEFATEINGKRTYFVEKIARSLVNDNTYDTDSILAYVCKVNPVYDINQFTNCHPKNITIRKDPDNYWEAFKPLEFYNKKKDILFAPTVLVKATQDIFITRKGYTLEITIAKVGSYIGGDDFYLLHQEKEKLALDDGFDTYEDFVLYYIDKIEQNGKTTGNYWYSGKIIHWTDLTY